MSPQNLNVDKIIKCHHKLNAEEIIKCHNIQFFYRYGGDDKMSQQTLIMVGNVLMTRMFTNVMRNFQKRIFTELKSI